ncbi:MAG: FixH family protein [Proteobacteria bacterium]|jgi:hypothetical protein|nr:FixH family protein [Pseudomonadota bacterium]
MTIAVESWQRNPWVWLLIAIPASSVLFGIVMVTTAIMYPDDLVADDYYRDGMAINEQLGREDRARDLNIDVTLTVEKGEVLLTTSAVDSALMVSLRHVVDRNQDVETRMVRRADGTFTATDDALVSLMSKSGLWYLEVSGLDYEWLIRRRVKAPLTAVSMVAE